MRMTPLDIQSHRFASRWRGLDPEEVVTFLRMVSEDYEALLHENQGQRERIRRLEHRVEELSAQEQLLKETLVSAQAMCDEMRKTADRDAEMRMAEVELKAEKILDASHRRAARLAEDIREMRALRSRLAEALRSAAETHLALLETLEQDPTSGALVDGMVEGKVSYIAEAPAKARAAGASESRKPAADKTGGG